MHTYKLIQNDQILETGSLLDCWKAMIEKFGDKTLNELSAEGIRIE